MGSISYTTPGSETARQIMRLVPFSSLRPEDLTALLAVARTGTAAPGTALPARDAAGNVLIAVLEGSVCLTRRSSAGPPCLVEICDAPCLVNEAALFDDARAAVTAEVLHRAVFVEFPGKSFLHCLQGNTAAQLRMLGYMSARLKRLIAQITTLKLMTGPQRLAQFLVALADRGHDRGTVHLPYEKRTLAALLGMTPESLSRAFRRLKGLGVESLPAGGVAIADIDRLRHFVEASAAN